MPRLKDVKKDDAIEHMPVIAVGDKYLSIQEGVFNVAALKNVVSSEKKTGSVQASERDPFGPDVLHVGI